LKTGLNIYVDGACRGNPGEAAIGVVIFQGSKRINEISRSIGEATNNIAEYYALIYALQEALILRADSITIHTDSELMHRQVTGQYKVKNPQLKILHDQVRHLWQGFKRIDFKHVLRDKNKDADQLASQALRQKQANVVTPLFLFSGEESPSSKG